jgi:hypothetical protein
MKDALACEKLWGAGKKLWSRDLWMGKPGPHLILFGALSELSEDKSHFKLAKVSIGNEREIKCGSSCTEYIGTEKRTQGTETSKYLKEKKSTEIPQVVASERGAAGNF